MRVQLEEYSDKIKRHLGLDIQVIKGDQPRFALSFDDLGVCELTLDPNTKFYKIGKLEPDLNDPDFVSRAQTTLNKTNDLSGFVVAMRKKFKSLN